MLSLLAGILLALLCSKSAVAIVPKVDTGYAVYVGSNTLPNVAAFLGVPYAQPPLGEQRWRAPVPLDTVGLRKNKQTIDATQYPEFCVQGTTGGGDAGGAGSEDCLKVNIYAPINATSESNLPVLVYIHGGGYIYGNPRNWPFDPWVQQSPNVVIVSVYYRLDVLGFLAHPALTDPAVGNLNAGFLDQIQALKWVQANIKAFGGNPAKVTINGQSAGGSSVELHLIANEGKNPLFSGAIGQSVYRAGLPTPEQQVPLFNYLLQNTSCTLPTPQAQISCLRKASISALIRSADSAGKFFLGLFNKWIPVVDKKVIKDYPTKLINAGRWSKVPVIAGATSNETLGYIGDTATDLLDFFPSITPAMTQDILDHYPPKAFESESLRHDTITGELELRCGRELIAGAASKLDLPSYGYRYNQPNPTGIQKDVVAHAAENFMMFQGTNTGPNGTTQFTNLNPVQKAFSEELIAYWLSFVRTLNPNTYKLDRSPEWPPFSFESYGQRQVLQEAPQNIIGTAVGSGIFNETEPSDEVSRCEYAFSIVETLQN
ncbi:hypothetical protein M422DRAFT_226303 [Sphaerobolus stellatus SS14]|nr:hypothetical protein M422DRAFT_226303 [Sphaerobolus stellatus SS14]